MNISVHLYCVYKEHINETHKCFLKSYVHIMFAEKASLLVTDSRYVAN